MKSLFRNLALLATTFLPLAGHGATAMKDLQISGASTVTGTLQSTGSGSIQANAVKSGSALETALAGKVSLAGTYSNPTWITALAWSKLLSTPTTAVGYGITGGANLDLWGAKTPYAGNLTITTGKTANVTNTLTLAGTDGSTLNVGTGGTLGTAAFTAASTYATSSAAATNATAISTETSRATAAEGVLTTSVATNTTAISTETSRATAAEGGLNTRVTTAEGAISTNSSSISTLTASFSTGLDPKKYLGPITSLSQGITAAGTAGAGAHYQIASGVSGTLSGTNAPAIPVAAGDYIVVNAGASAYVRRAAPPTSLLDGSVTLPKTTGGFNPFGNLDPSSVTADGSVPPLPYTLADTVNIGLDATTFIQTTPAATAGYVTRFRVKLPGAITGRTVNFYICDPTNTGKVTARYASGSILAEAAGDFTWTPTDIAAAHISAGELIAVYVSSGGVRANNLVTAPANGGYFTGSLTVGVEVTYALTVANRTHFIDATVTAELLSVPRAWMGVAGGVPTLNSNGLLLASQAPNTLTAASSLDSSARVVTEYEVGDTENAVTPIKVVESVGTKETYSGFLSPYSIDAFPVNYLLIGWRNTDALVGFQSSGVLRAVKLWQPITSVPGAKIYGYVVRPNDRTSPTAWTIVHRIGEIDASVAGTKLMWRGLALPVQAGDMIGLRGEGYGVSVGGSSAAWLSWTTAVKEISGSGLGVVTDAQLASGVVPSAGRSSLYEAVIDPYPSTTSRNVANAAPELDGNGDAASIPIAANQWKGKKIIVVGTSIEAQGASELSGYKGYYREAGDWLGANLINEAIGSSGMCWDGTSFRDRSLTATKAELLSVFGSSAFYKYSYEQLIIGRGADMVVIAHGFNDSGYALGTINSTDRATVMGAWNYLIQAIWADNPACKIVLVGPAHYAPGGTLDSGKVAVADAIGQIAAKYYIPYLRLGDTTEVNSITAAALLNSEDLVHPNALLSRRMARTVYQFLIAQ